jgi:ParB-like chromosome segregation protein Spo0J
MSELQKYEVIADLGNGLVIAKVNVNDLREQDVNARVMTKEMMEALAKIIRKRGRLESLPYCALTDRGIEVVSGHHRVRACRMAEVMTIHVLLDTSKLSRNEIIARQLAHNSVQGVDDKELLRKLYEDITDVDLELGGVRGNMGSTVLEPG